MKLYDFHTHQISANALYIIDPRSLEIPENQYFFMGAHPWYIEQINLELIINRIIEIHNSPYFVGIGEIGLDKSINVDYELQIKVFTNFLELATQLGIKSIKIHCVKAYSDIISILKKSTFKGLVIFHDFNGNKEIINSLLSTNSIFSLGERVLNQNSKIAKALKNIPLERIVIETDEAHPSKLQEIALHITKELSISTSKFENHLKEIFLKLTAS